MAYKSHKEWGKILWTEDESDGSLTYTRTIIVFVDDPLDQADVAMAVAPARGSTLSVPGFSDPNAYCLSRTPQLKGDGNDLAFLIECKYSTKIDQKTKDKAQYPNPLERPPYDHDFDAKSRQIPRTKDVDGKPVVNAAGDYFVDPIVEEVRDPTWSFSVNAATPGYDLIREYVGDNGSVNDAPIWGWEEGEVLCESIKVSGPFNENGYLFWKRRFTFVFRVDGWKTSAANMGKYEVVMIEGYPAHIPIFDKKYKLEVTEPVKLNEDGTVADEDADVNFIDFQFHRSADFGALGFTPP